MNKKEKFQIKRIIALIIDAMHYLDYGDRETSREKIKHAKELLLKNS